MQWIDDKVLHNDINRLKCLLAAEYVLSVDLAVELQNSLKDHGQVPLADRVAKTEDTSQQT